MISDYFGRNNKIGHKDLILFFDLHNFGFRLNEVIIDLEWRLEAYYEQIVGSHTIRVVFNSDVISPRKKLTQKELKQLLKKLTERKNYVQKSLQL